MPAKPVVAKPTELATDILETSFGKGNPVSLQVTYQELHPSQPGPTELRLMFRMLDTLLQSVPFDEWEN